MNIPRATLEAAFLRERPHRPHWPDTFERAIQDPVTRSILETLARHQQPAVNRRPAVWQPELEAVDRPSPLIRRKRAPLPDGFDQKRLASGDKPEDD